MLVVKVIRPRGREERPVALWVMSHGVPAQVYSIDEDVQIDAGPGFFSLLLIEHSPGCINNVGHAYIAVLKESTSPLFFGHRVDVKPTKELAVEARILPVLSRSSPDWGMEPAKSQGYTIRVTGEGLGFWDPTQEFEKTSLALIERCTSRHTADCTGFERIRNLSTAHASIVTSQAVGCFESTAAPVTPSQWTNAVHIAHILCGSPEWKKLSDDGLKCVLWISLASFGFLREWTEEERDSQCLPWMFFHQKEDCEDQSASVVAATRYLARNFHAVAAATGGLAQKLVLLLGQWVGNDPTLGSAFMTSGFAVINGERIGHSFPFIVVKTEKGLERKVIESTAPVLPFGVSSKELTLARSEDDAVCVISASKEMYEAVDMVFTDTAAFHPTKNDKVGVGFDDFCKGKCGFDPVVPEGCKEAKRYQEVFSGMIVSPVLDTTKNDNLRRFHEKNTPLFPEVRQTPLPSIPPNTPSVLRFVDGISHVTTPFRNYAVCSEPRYDTSVLAYVSYGP